MDWNHLCTFEAIARLGSLTLAARSLRISQSTASRHLQALEREAGSTLLLRHSPLELTQRGRALLEAMRPMVDAAQEAQAALRQEQELRGEVTVTTVGELARWELTPRLPAFYAAYPRLRLRILARPQVQSLAAGEADISLRVARPTRGDLVARRLGQISYGVYQGAGLELQGRRTPWLGLTGELGALVEQRYAQALFAGRAPRLLIEDMESLGLAVASDLGVAVLPRSFARTLEGVRQVDPALVGEAGLSLPSREVWMVVHPSRQRVQAVRAVMGWLAQEV
jgi:DNA-binding transcriptional LysR family regulator